MPKSPVTQDQIREAAYQLWLDAGEPSGMEQDFWFRAEAALTAAKPTAAKAKAAPRKAAAKPATKAKAKAPAKRKPAAKA